jgi:hypothetical protein
MAKEEAMKKKVEKVQAELEPVLAKLAEGFQVVAGLRSLLDDEERSASEEEATWETCPSLGFHIHGLLSLALDEGEQALVQLREASEATPETLHTRWSQFRAQRHD